MNTRSKKFDYLVRPHVGHLYKIACRLLGTRTDAEDLVQEVLIKIYPRTEEMEHLEHPRAWMARILYNQFVDTLRKQARRPRLHVFPQDESGGNALDDIPAPDAAPDQILDQSTISPNTQTALDQLDPEHKALVVLHLVEGYTLSELSIIMNKPLETLKTRLRRAKARLKQTIKVHPF